MVFAAANIGVGGGDMLAERIYNLRKRRALSQEELAEALGVSRQTVSKWERGAAVPELDKLRALSELFGVSLDELAGDGAARPEAPAERKPARLGVALCLFGALGLLGIGAALLFAPERTAALDAASAVTFSGSGIALMLCVAVMGAGLWLTLRKK